MTGYSAAIGGEMAMASSGQPAKLVKSAQEFEAMLLQNLMEKMSHSLGEGSSEDAAHDTLSGLGTQEVAAAIAARGGIGIANLLLSRLRVGTAQGIESERSGSAVSDG